MFQIYPRESKSYVDCAYLSTGKKGTRRKMADEVAEDARSREVTVAADMVFSMSNNLSGVSLHCN